MPAVPESTPPSDHATLGGAFAELGVSARFDLDLRALRLAWMQRAASVHPDAEGAAESSARVNEAYRTLVEPLARAAELLCVRGAPSVDQRALPDGFLVRMMELRESADEARGDLVAVGRLKRHAEREREAALDRIAAAFATQAVGPLDSEAARVVWTEINVARAFERMLEQLDREVGGT
jgi:DnaJ-domain-containing protein 1